MGVGKTTSTLRNLTMAIRSTQFKKRACKPTPLFVSVFRLNFFWYGFLNRQGSLDAR